MPSSCQYDQISSSRHGHLDPRRSTPVQNMLSISDLAGEGVCTSTRSMYGSRPGARYGHRRSRSDSSSSPARQFRDRLVASEIVEFRDLLVAMTTPQYEQQEDLVAVFSIS